MTDREIAERVHGLLILADQLRLPGHRRTAEQCMEAQDEVRAGLRRFYRELTGEDVQRHQGSGHQAASLGHVGLLVPTALIRHRARRHARA